MVVSQRWAAYQLVQVPGQGGPWALERRGGCMRLKILVLLLVSAVGLTGCTSTRSISSADFAAPSGSTLARIYYWRARPGKLDEYNRYIREIAEPIDREATAGSVSCRHDVRDERLAFAMESHADLSPARLGSACRAFSRARHRRGAAGAGCEPPARSERVCGHAARPVRRRNGRGAPVNPIR